MSDLRTAAQQALEALEGCVKALDALHAPGDSIYTRASDLADRAEIALLAALAQQEQAMRDALTTGTGVLLGGERINPASVYKQQEQEQEADYPEEKLQAVAEYVSDKYHVWYGVAARDIEEVLRQSVSCGLVSNPPRREWQGLTEEEIEKLWRTWVGTQRPNYSFTHAIEQALKERNT